MGAAATVIASVVISSVVPVFLTFVTSKIKDIFESPPVWEHPTHPGNENTQNPGTQSQRYATDKVHIAVAGAAGTGKSSLINSLRGLTPKSPGAAPTKSVETTTEVTQYPDARYPWIVWCDVPGGNTPNFPAEGYFENQGLTAMDGIVVLWGDRFLQLDLDIIRAALKNDIKVFVVRSKSDMHIRNIAIAEADNPSDEQHFNLHRAEAKQTYITESRDNLRQHLTEHGLLGDIKIPDDFFLVSCTLLRGLMIKTEDLDEVQAIRKDEEDLGIENLDRDEDRVRSIWETAMRAIKQYLDKCSRSPEFIDDQRFLESVLSTVAKNRY